MESVITGSLKTFNDISGKIGGDVKKMSDLLTAAFQAESSVISQASGMAKPADAQLATLFKPCSDAINNVMQFKESNRRSEYFNHLSAVAESTGALQWIAAPLPPLQYIKEMIDAGVFYSNRVLKDFKEKDPLHGEWVKALKQVWTDMQNVVKQSYLQGLVWNAGPPAPGGAPPPPPPPPPPPVLETGGGSDADRGALFAELNRGEGVTAGLRKVTADMQTHKNPNLRAAGGDPAPAAHKAAPPAVPLRPDQRKAKPPPCLELQGSKWVVENYDGNNEIVVEVAEPKQTVYIYNCANSVIKVKGKCNSIALDTCKKCGLLFEEAISMLDVTNCIRAQVQVTGKVPTVSIDKTDGCQIYLSKESLDVEIVTAKSSELNLLVPDGDEFKEMPVPEQYKHKITDKGLVTTPTDLA